MSSAAVPHPITPAPSPARPIGDGPYFVMPPHAHSLAGFRAWYASDDFPEEGRIEYLGGEIFVDMSHERLSSHVSLKGEFARTLIALVEELDLGQFFTDGVRIVNEGADLSNEPDGCFISWGAVESGRVRFQESRDGQDVSEVVGSPDMVLEIVSPSSVRKDTVRLPDLYHRAGVSEYWLVDARGDEIIFQLLRHTPEGFAPTPEVEGWRLSSVFGHEVRLERTRNRAGLWRYKLQLRRNQD